MKEIIYSGNNGILAIETAIFFAVSFKFYIQSSKILNRFLFGTIAICCLFIIVVLQSRAAELSAFVVAFYFGYPLLKKRYHKNKITFLFSGGFTAFLIILAGFTKAPSSAGRAFIFKNCMSILQEHWIKGVGWGKFNPVYNHQQAKYFTTHSLVDGTAIRANDGYYAFNEWIHVWIETGISGFIFLTLLTSCIGYLIVKNINRRNNWHSCILIPILVSSFFSYPLHNTLLFCLALFSVVGLGVTYIFKKKWLEFKYAKALAFALASIVSVVILLREGYIENTLSKAQSALEDEFKTEAYELLMKLENENLHSRSGDLLLFNLMYKTGRIEELIALFPKIHKRHCNQSLHSDLAKAYEEKREYVKAENHYFTALYIAPYRLQSRLDLMNFYWKKGDQQKAKYWAQQILDAPMKYITSEAIYIKRKAANFLQLPLQPTVNSL